VPDTKLLPHTRSNVRRLHAMGLMDREIAERCGVKEQATGKVRRRLGLPSNHRIRWSKELAEQCVNRILNGESRESVAKSIGLRTVGALTSRLHELIGGRDYDTFHRPVKRWSAAWNMIAAGMTNREIAAELGITSDHVTLYRKIMPDWWAEDMANNNTAPRRSPKAKTAA